jgi:hypothetical protein
MEIVEDESKPVAGFEFGVPRYEQRLVFHRPAKECDAETAALLCQRLLHQFRRSRICVPLPRVCCALCHVAHCNPQVGANTDSMS